MRQRASAVLMPEAAMHKDDLAAGRENQIGPAREIMPVQSVAIPQAMHEPAHEHFRFHPRAADSTHIRAAVHVTYLVLCGSHFHKPVQAADL